MTNKKRYIKLTIDYNYDPEDDKIYESRSIQRVTNNNCIEFLKANFQILDSASVPAELYEVVKSEFLYSYDIQLPESKLETVMDDKFDLFVQGNEFIAAGTEINNSSTYIN